MAKLVDAVWVGGYPARLDSPGHEQDGLELVHGKTVVKVPAGEARDSGNWKPKRSAPTAAEKAEKAKAAKAKRAKAKAEKAAEAAAQTPSGGDS